MPTALRKKLGDDATEGQVALLNDTANERDERFSYVMEDRIALHIKESEGKLRQEMHGGFLGVEKRFGQMEEKFGRLESKFERQITLQTRWIIVAIGFLGLSLELARQLLK